VNSDVRRQLLEMKQLGTHNQTAADLTCIQMYINIKLTIIIPSRVEKVKAQSGSNECDSESNSEEQIMKLYMPTDALAV
jgi:hypothetical protein